MRLSERAGETFMLEYPRIPFHAFYGQWTVYMLSDRLDDACPGDIRGAGGGGQ